MIERKRQTKEYVIATKDAPYYVTNRKNEWIGEIVHEDEDAETPMSVSVETVSIKKSIEGLNGYPEYTIGGFRFDDIARRYLTPVPYPTWKPEYDDLP